MNRTFVIIKRELFALHLSPLLYGTALFFLLFMSIWFYYFRRFFTMDVASLRPFFAGFPLAFTLVVPSFTMKLWAEEQKLGTIEILLTMPFSEWNLVLGKFLSAFIVLSGLILLTVPVPLSIMPLGDFDAGVITGEYIGTLLMGASATALGLLLSSLAKNQAGAFLGSVSVLLIVMLINNITRNLQPAVAQVLNFFSLSFHFESFSKGILDTRDLSFFLLSTALFLFLNTRIIIFRKYR